MWPYLTWMKLPTPEHCRVCGWNKHSHGQRYTSEEFIDQIPIECIPHFGETWASSTFHYYVPITMPEFKEYLLRKRNDNTS